ncbi:hypothetical protein CJ030_MR3G026268 [Morella rubra]|uniref:60S ribosomal protein L18a-like protein n=1 Tax=Morella rubra TaxID=262757 RepID=A0A6A1W3T3_9ROSI|nr:hypothetical protein CJ030_MR3G026268 [Morella rubra]
MLHGAGALKTEREAESIVIIYLEHMDRRLSTDLMDSQNGDYVNLKDAESPQLGMFDKPLPCCGCGIGWCSLLLGFACPLIWYYATILYFRRYYHKDPRERDGLVANTVAALIFTIAVIITVVVIGSLKLAGGNHH